MFQSLRGANSCSLPRSIPVLSLVGRVQSSVVLHGLEHDEQYPRGVMSTLSYMQMSSPFSAGFASLWISFYIAVQLLKCFPLAGGGLRMRSVRILTL
jgi:hypothetical protein